MNAFQLLHIDSCVGRNGRRMFALAVCLGVSQMLTTSSHAAPPPPASRAADDGARPTSPWVPLLTDEECRRQLPPRAHGGDGPLPNWARAVAVHLPRTAAAMLELDHAHRTRSPLDPQLRAKLRWVIAHANHCAYSEAYALADLRRAGAGDVEIDALTGDPAAWPESERDALQFVRLMTLAAPTIEDTLFARLRDAYGDHGAAAIVLLAAYGNFQDRIVLGLNLPMEADGPLPPIDVKFADGSLQVAALIPTPPTGETQMAAGTDVIEDDPEWASRTYDQLQVQLEAQREREPRLPIPAWDDVKTRLPAPMAARPTKIVWSLTCLGYVPELAVPWSIATRTLWSEAPNDRVFEESLFWIQTRAIGCNYCMGHCEMLLEVAGLDRNAIADRTRLLAGTDWSSFPAAEQRAFAYARKLSRTPWQLSEADYRTLEADYGSKQALSIFWWLCRGLYMTRISDGFQLPLERENVFKTYAPPAESATKN